MPDTPTLSRSHPASPPPAADEGLFCPQCGYSLRGLGESGGIAGEVRCPECGFAVNLQTLHQSIIPWVHRADIGRWRAYWRTVRLVTGRPRAVAGEVSKPLRLEDAEGFRRVTAFLVFLPLAALVVWAYVASLRESVDVAPIRWLGSALALEGVRHGGRVLARGHVLGWLLEWAVVGALVLGLWLFSLGVTGITSYFFHPPGLTVVQQNRAIAVSYFGCAVLSYTPLSAGLLVIAVGGANAAHGRGYAAVQAQNLCALAGAIGVLMILGQLALWYRCTLTMLRRASYGSTLRVWTAALSLPFATLLLAALTMIVLPAGIALVGLVVLSFA